MTVTEWLTTVDAAKELLVNADKVRSWIEAGELLASDVTIQQGGRPRWRIARRDLDAFLRRRQPALAREAAAAAAAKNRRRKAKAKATSHAYYD